MVNVKERRLSKTEGQRLERLLRLLFCWCVALFLVTFALLWADAHLRGKYAIVEEYLGATGYLVMGTLRERPETGGAKQSLTDKGTIKDKSVWIPTFENPATAGSVPACSEEAENTKIMFEKPVVNTQLGRTVGAFRCYRIVKSEAEFYLLLRKFDLTMNNEKAEEKRNEARAKTAFPNLLKLAEEVYPENGSFNFLYRVCLLLLRGVCLFSFIYAVIYALVHWLGKRVLDHESDGEMFERLKKLFEKTTEPSAGVVAANTLFAKGVLGGAVILALAGGAIGMVVVFKDPVLKFGDPPSLKGDIAMTLPNNRLEVRLSLDSFNNITSAIGRVTNEVHNANRIIYTGFNSMSTAVKRNREVTDKVLTGITDLDGRIQQQNLLQN